ncbi:oligosaccharide flippase family protein [Brevundimonas sp.]|uniref:oligosaccharide flippase family protein n=1 Tax=Brevundimonas sp. TaxID=1871086 RepID=UPI0026056B6C|nr:oligosaccharide flippase family protein [Brevundimonas sp.]
MSRFQDSEQTQEPGEGSHMLTGVRWLVFGRLLVMALSLIGTAVLSRLLTPLEFGMMAAALAVIGFADSMFEGAFGLNLIHAQGIDEDDVATSFWSVFALSVVLAAAIVLFAPLIERFYSTSGIAVTIAFGSLVVVARGIGAIPRAVMQRSGDFRGLVGSNTVAYLIGQFALSIGLALLGFGVWSLVWGSVVTGAIEAGLNLVQSRIKPWRRVFPGAAVALVRDSSPYALSQLLSWAANNGANIVVGRTLGIVSLGLFSRGWRLVEIINALVSTPLQRVLFPAFATLRGDSRRAGAVMASALRSGLPVFGLAAVAAALHASAIVRLLLGPAWVEVILILQLLALGLLPRCAYKVTESVAFGMGNSAGTAVRSAIQAVLLVGAAFVGGMFGLLPVAGFLSAAMWIYYLISLGYAASLVIATVGDLLRLHAKAMLPVAVFAIADSLAASAVPEAWFWISHFVGGGAGLLAVLLFMALVPRTWLGPEWSTARDHLTRPVVGVFRRPGA